MGQYQYSTYGDSSVADAGDPVDQIFFAGAALAYLTTSGSLLHDRENPNTIK